LEELGAASEKTVGEIGGIESRPRVLAPAQEGEGSVVQVSDSREPV
jgi:hypothetical protein